MEIMIIAVLVVFRVTSSTCLVEGLDLYNTKAEESRPNVAYT